jgi:selT/selW/selH-like putative selenoprotein
LAAAIRDHTGSDTELLAGSNGIFDVTLDGKLLFSKDREGRFPSDDEILAALDASKPS